MSCFILLRKTHMLDGLWNFQSLLRHTTLWIFCIVKVLRYSFHRRTMTWSGKIVIFERDWKNLRLLVLHTLVGNSKRNRIIFHRQTIRDAWWWQIIRSFSFCKDFGMTTANKLSDIITQHFHRMMEWESELIERSEKNPETVLIKPVSACRALLW